MSNSKTIPPSCDVVGRILARRIAAVAAAAVALGANAAGAFAQGFTISNLVSNQPGVAAVQDPNLVNAWGIALSATSPFWINDNGTGLSTLYTGTGAILSLVVTVPPPSGSPGPSAPTGIVFNGTPDFQVTPSGPGSHFIFDTEDGTISAWGGGTAATLEVDNSTVGLGAVYKGLALISTPNGNFLLATNFRSGRIEVYDRTFHLVRSFTDHHLPPRYAPFGIANLNGTVYVTFALQDRLKHDSDAGPGRGFVDVLDTNRLSDDGLHRLISRGALDAPWGVAVAPASFGFFAGSLLVGNFGNGWINAFDPVTGTQIGWLSDPNFNPIVIDGLWGLIPGNDHSGGSSQNIYFTAGPNGESDGLFGSISPAQPLT